MRLSILAVLWFYLFGTALAVGGGHFGDIREWGELSSDEQACLFLIRDVKALDGPDATFYSLLGVSEHMSSRKIKNRFRDLSRTQHPDKVLGDIAAATHRYALLTAVYAILKDPEPRIMYHDLLDAGLDTIYPPPPSPISSRFGGSFWSSLPYELLRLSVPLGLLLILRPWNMRRPACLVAPPEGDTDRVVVRRGPGRLGRKKNARPPQHATTDRERRR